MHGGTYIGSVDRLNRPNGLGKEYFPPLNQHRVRYYGYYLNGKKHGNGTLYNNDGGISHHGEFLYGKPIININGENVKSVTPISKRIFTQISYLDILIWRERLVLRSFTDQLQNQVLMPSLQKTIRNSKLVTLQLRYCTLLDTHRNRQHSC